MVEPTKPEKTPEWVPAMWTSGRFNRWFWRSPGRMVIWLTVVPFLLAVLTLLTARSGGWLVWVFAALTVWNAAQAVVYVPVRGGHTVTEPCSDDSSLGWASVPE